MSKERGSITERGNSCRIEISLGKNKQTGKYERYSETIRGSVKEARERRREILTSLDKGVFIKPTALTVGSYLDQWLEDIVKVNLAARTHELYSYLSKKHIQPALGKLTLSELKPTHLTHLYAAKQNAGLSKRTVQLIHAVMYKALDSAVKHQIVSLNVAAAVESPKAESPEMAFMSEGDIKHFLEAAQRTEYYDLFFVFLFTGLRRNEALALRWSDIDFMLGELSVNRAMQFVNNTASYKIPKTERSRRVVALSPSTIEVLREHRHKQDKVRHDLDLPATSSNDLIFSDVNGSPLRPDTVSHAWKKLARKCGLTDIHVHSARHSHASLLLSQGVNIKIISERLGHTSTSFTMDTYAHSVKTLQKDAANGFDALFTPDLHQEGKMTPQSSLHNGSI